MSLGRQTGCSIERAGFRRDGQRYGIFVRDVEPASTWLPEGVLVEEIAAHAWRLLAQTADLIGKEVHTLLYNGLWVDGYSGGTPGLLLDAAAGLAAQRQLDEIGIVVAREDRAADCSSIGRGKWEVPAK